MICADTGLIHQVWHMRWDQQMAAHQQSAAMYLMDSAAANDGKTPYRATLKDVPVVAFWSITVNNVDGFLEANDCAEI